MTCRHGPNDPNCSSHPSYVDYSRESKSVYDRYSSGDSPDPDKYSIEDTHRVGPHLVLKVKYPNCRNCSFEGTKVLVCLNVTEAQALRWRKIDPHFRGGKTVAGEAPSPAARFPATAEGWADAIEYATRKSAK